MDPLDGLPQEGGHGQGPDPGAAGDGRVDRDGVGHEQGLEFGALDPLQGGAREDPMDGRGVRPFRAPRPEGGRGLNQGPGGVDDVVEDQDVLAGDVADDVAGSPSRFSRCAACR